MGRDALQRQADMSDVFLFTLCFGYRNNKSE